MFLQDTYLPRKSLANLKKYHYQGQDDSILSKLVYKRFWSWVEDYIPMWLAPNVITFSGFGLAALCYVLLMAYTPLMDEAAPSWVYI